MCGKRNDVSDATFEVRGFVGLWVCGDPLLIDVCVRTKGASVRGEEREDIAAGRPRPKAIVSRTVTGGP
jgi:hypothetical protein